LGSNVPVKFNLQYHNLESLHPVDIARIIFEGPGYKQGSKVISALKDPLAADIIEELSPQLQQNLVESMQIDDVADVVNHMPAHKAADLILTMGPDFAQKILPRIKDKHAAKITILLNYPENSVGAFMTTDYLSVPRNLTVEDVYERLADFKQLPDFSLYIYVIESDINNKLIGVFSIYELYRTNRRSRIEQFMIKNPISITAHLPLEEALKKMYRYNLSALPVVSRKEGRLLGIITFKDTVSHYLPKRWKTRIHQILFNSQ
jgi:magnesium transporter